MARFEWDKNYVLESAANPGWFIRETLFGYQWVSLERATVWAGQGFWDKGLSDVFHKYVGVARERVVEYQPRIVLADGKES